MCFLKYLFVCFALTTISACALGRADNLPARYSARLYVPSFIGMSDAQAANAAEAVAESHEALTEAVTRQIVSPNLTNQQKWALYGIAGDFQLYGAIDAMINNINIRDNRIGPPPGQVLPAGSGEPVAQVALAGMGMPAFNELIRVMNDENKRVPFVESNVDGYAWVIWAIEGKKYAVLRLQDQMAPGKTEKVLRQYRLVINRLASSPDNGYNE